MVQRYTVFMRYDGSVLCCSNTHMFTSSNVYTCTYFCQYIAFLCLRTSRKIDLSNEWPLEIKYILLFLYIIIFFYFQVYRVDDFVYIWTDTIVQCTSSQTS